MYHFRRDLIAYYFFFNDTATTEIYTLSLHDALPISLGLGVESPGRSLCGVPPLSHPPHSDRDRKSTRLNSSHANISYAVFCLKKKKKVRETLNHALMETLALAYAADDQQSY